jgi:hypothetical protein
MALKDDTTFNSINEPFIEPGDSYKIHTFLGIYVGRVVALNPGHTHAKLDCCSWIPDEGRMGEAMRKGALAEVEFLGDGVMVPLSGVIMPWRHRLPTETK